MPILIYFIQIQSYSLKMICLNQKDGPKIVLKIVTDKMKAMKIF